MSDETEDVLERFTDPVKKRKRKEKKEKKEDDKRQKIVNDGKKWAKDEFNTPPTPEQLVMWNQYVDATRALSIAELERLVEESQALTTEFIEYQNLPKIDGLYAVMNCLNAFIHCGTWISKKLTEMGWKINMTGYDPVAVSHSTQEVLTATLECYRMALKQMLMVKKQQHIQ